LPNSLFPNAVLADFYRFAVLLTGSGQAAEQVMAQTLKEAEGQLTQIRNETNRHAWLAARIRERCLQLQTHSEPPPGLLRGEEEKESSSQVEVLEIEAYLVAQRFHRLPEPERSALALFYFDFFTIEEMAKLLKIHEEQLADLLSRARALLQEQLREMRDSAA
jgi:RNA polymerase sigma-70 factor (ECF subfamily)